MIKNLTEKLKQKKFERQEAKLEKKNTKPQYSLGDLYVGEIVLHKNYKPAGFGIVDHYYRIEKKFAIFTETGYNEYCHIKSNQKLYDMCSSCSIIGDYAVHNAKKFKEVFPIYMRENNISNSTKVSYQFIVDFEENFNKQLAPEQEVVELFK